MSNKIIFCLIIANSCVGLFAFSEGNFWRGVYWFGAAIINTAVLNLK